MAEVLKQALRSLCNRTGWCYAVFWKLKRRSRMVLTWEDGYYEFATVQMSANAALLTGSGRNPLEHGVFKQDGGVVEDQIELAVAKMSFHVYSLGEGIIGRVAFTGKHQWIFAGGERSLEGGSAASEKYPDGWSNQFAAGIKTIAVVAVQQGVVQLGSTQVMMEDLNLVGQIRALFGTLQSVPGAFVSDFVPEVPRCLPVSKTPAVSRTTSSLTTLGSFGRTPLMGRSATAISPVTMRDFEAEQHSNTSAKLSESAALYAHLPANAWGSLTIPTIEQRSAHEMSIPSAGFPAECTGGSYLRRNSGAPNALQADLSYAKRVKLPYDVSSLQIPSTVGAHNKLSHNSFTRGEQSSSNFSPDSSSRGSNFGTCDLPGSHGFKHFDSNIWSPSVQASTFSVGDFEAGPPFGEETGVAQAEEGFDYSSLFKAFQKDDLDDFHNLLASLNKEYSGQANGSATGSQFVIGDELSEVLLKNGSGKEEATGNNMLISPSESVKIEKQHVTSFELPSEIIMDKAPVYGDILVGLSDSKPEQLLDAVVAGASTLPLCSNSLKESSKDPLTGKLPGPAPVAAPAGNVSHYPEKQVSGTSSLDRDVAVNWPSSSVEVSSSSWTAEERTLKDTPTTRKQDEPARIIGRKRLRPGEAPRPRPKDRQQIQDRVRELRDIVPNATKCSIDALLEKTIKHMKFLQSVTQHGDKWKAGPDMKGDRIVEHNGLQSGASWALEFDGKGAGVPIHVENLTQPRQMLVEMLCEERGLFWEIAENIRSLGLTILKGVMESRNDKIWARFNVEATKEVNRLKVVCNLTQLLKPNAKSGTVGGAAPSYSGSEVTDVCSESFTTRFQPQVASHGITVSPGGW